MVTNVLKEPAISIFRAEVYKTLHCHNQIPKSEFMIKLYDAMDWINGAQFLAREMTVCLRATISKTASGSSLLPIRFSCLGSRSKSMKLTTCLSQCHKRQKLGFYDQHPIYIYICVCVCVCVCVSLLNFPYILPVFTILSMKVMSLKHT